VRLSAEHVTPCHFGSHGLVNSPAVKFQGIPLFLMCVFHCCTKGLDPHVHDKDKTCQNTGHIILLSKSVCTGPMGANYCSAPQFIVK
jgi:hypothetical protein